MDGKDSNLADRLKIGIGRYEKVVEISTWAVVVAIIFGVRIIPNPGVDDFKAYLLIGLIVAFALFYYLVIYKYFSRSKRLYLKSIADIVLIGSLILILKDYGQYFYALFFLPIAAAALSLEFINALLIAVIASLFVVFEIFLGSQDILPQQAWQGAWQIALILLITIFCRALANQVREERQAKEEAEARRKALAEEAIRQKEFISLTAHQLYTPLSMIRGFSSMLHDGSLGEMEASQKDAAGEIYTSSKRMTDLVSELLSISRIQSGKIVMKKMEVDIAALIRECTAQFQKSMPKKDVQIIFEESSLPKLSADQDKIRQILYILLDNALKYTPKGKINITCQDETDTVVVAVKDEGAGIPTEDFDKLFQPFFRGQNILELDNKGTGLGLYIARLLVEMHGGRIWAKSPGPGQGATFSFSLPKAD